MGRDRLVEALRRAQIRDADPQVVDDALALVAAMNRLDAVAVWIEQERPVVLLAVLRPEPRLAVARVTGLRPGAPELIDLLARWRDEGDVQSARPRMLGLGAR